MRAFGKVFQEEGYAKLWAGVSVSFIGSEFTNLALPTIALILLHANATEVGFLRAVGLISFPLFGLIAGVWTDRLNPKNIMIVSDIGRFMALLSIPVFYYFDYISLLQLFVVAIITGTFTVFFNVSYMAYLPMLLKREQLLEGNTKVSLSLSASQVIGPALAGTFIGIIGAAKVIIFDAISYLLSALSLFAIKKKSMIREVKTESEEKAHFGKELKEGLAYVFQHSVLRAITLVTACANFGFMMAQPMLLVYAYNTLGLKPIVAGAIFGVGSSGMIFGAMAAPKINQKIGIGRSMFLALLLQGIAIMAICLSKFAIPEALLGIGWFVAAFAMPIYDINQVSLRQSLTPIELQGRMNASMRTIILGIAPVGSLLGGLISDHISVLAAIVLGGIFIIASAFFCKASVLYPIRTQPTPLAEQGTASA